MKALENFEDGRRVFLLESDPVVFNDDQGSGNGVTSGTNATKRSRLAALRFASNRGHPRLDRWAWRRRDDRPKCRDRDRAMTVPGYDR